MGKHIKKGFVFCGLAAGLFFTGKQEAWAADLESLFYANIKENVITDSYDSAGLYAPGIFEHVSYDAFLALKELDLDQDGEKELLTIRLQDDEQSDTSVLNAKVYEKNGNKITPVSEYVIAEDVLCADTVNCDVFLLYDSGSIYICCEDKEDYQLLSDGVDWNLRIIRFSGDSFEEWLDESIVGSEWKEKQISYVYKELATLSFYPNDLINLSLVDQMTENMEKLCSISRYVTVGYEDLWNYLSYGDGGYFEYGETAFYDYANEGFANKIVTSFGTETVADERNVNSSERYQNQNLSDASDFIFPDSDVRYLSKYDLAGLSAYQLRIARNEIYARHGRGFQDEELRNYFNSKSWYQETVSPERFTYEYASRVLNIYEVANIDTIKEYEALHNYNQ